jgi:hypothetical protein
MADLQRERLHRTTALASRSSYVGSIIITSGDELSSKTPSLELILTHRKDSNKRKTEAPNGTSGLVALDRITAL